MPRRASGHRALRVDAIYIHRMRIPPWTYYSADCVSIVVVSHNHDVILDNFDTILRHGCRCGRSYSVGDPPVQHMIQSVHSRPVARARDCRSRARTSISGNSYAARSWVILIEAGIASTLRFLPFASFFRYPYRNSYLARGARRGVTSFSVTTLIETPNTNDSASSGGGASGKASGPAACAQIAPGATRAPARPRSPPRPVAYMYGSTGGPQIPATRGLLG